MVKRTVEMNDKFAVVTVFREDFLNREYESNSPACVVYNDKYFNVRQKVFSFLYRNNFFNPKLSYAILGSNTPFETSEQPTDPTTPTDPTDPANPEQPGKPSEQTESPQTGDSSNMMLWIGLMLASCGGVIGMAVYSKRKKVC